MENDEAVITSEVTSEPTPKKSREKSVRYPAKSLKQCLDFLSMVHSIGGKKEAPVESILSKMNLTSADTKSYKSIVSSVEIFGLIEKMTNGIKPTNIATLILFPPNGDEERKKLLIETFKSPQLYQKIIERYDNMILPNNTILKNVFLHYGIATKALDNAVDAFLESAQYVNVLDSNNRLIVNVSSESKLLSKQSQDAGEVINEQKLNSDLILPTPATKEPPQSTSDFYKFEIPTSNGKMASIVFPIDAQKEDIEKLIKLLQVFSTV